MKLQAIELTCPDCGAAVEETLISHWDEDEAKLQAEITRLRAAAQAALDWFNRFGADSPICFGGEAELATQLQAALTPLPPPVYCDNCNTVLGTPEELDRRLCGECLAVYIAIYAPKGTDHVD